MTHYEGFCIPETEDEMYQLHKQVFGDKADIHGEPTIVLPREDNFSSYIHTGIRIAGFIQRHGPISRFALSASEMILHDAIRDNGADLLPNGRFVWLWRSNIKGLKGINEEHAEDGDVPTTIQGSYGSLRIKVTVSEAWLNMDGTPSIEELQRIMDDEAKSMIESLS